MGSGHPFAMRVGEGVFESVGGICENGVEAEPANRRNNSCAERSRLSRRILEYDLQTI